MKGQMKIQQMSLMIMAIFFFFILVGLFFVSLQFKDVGKAAAQLQKDAAISSMGVIANMPELNCGSGEQFCLDVDKLKVMSGGIGNSYELFWPVASIKVYKVYPAFDSEIKCPAEDCNYYDVYDRRQTNSREYSTFVSLCQKVKETGYVYEKCETGKLVVGMKIYEE